MRIPHGFDISVATAATQIEGAADLDGKTASVWDDFAALPGRIDDSTTPALPALRSYERLDDDLDLLADLGVDGYRFSLSWPRILPHGGAVANERGIAYYDRLIDGLLERGIAPVCTVHHWDVPRELQELGGWQNIDTASRLADLAQLAGERFGDRVARWVTLNEPATVTLNGYALGIHAPGHELAFKATEVALIMGVGHARAARALRSAGVRGEIGVTLSHSPASPDNPRRTADIVAARMFDAVHNGIFFDPILLGTLPKLPLGLGKLLDSQAAKYLPEISVPLDFLGVNYYQPTRVRGGFGSGVTPDGESETMNGIPLDIRPWPGAEVTGFGWPIVPAGLPATMRLLQRRYGDALPPIRITECGASFPDEVVAGRVDDERRIRFLRDHLEAALRVRESGIDLREFTIWSLTDNWEWAAGMTQRFGLVHVDTDTGERTRKDSYSWLQRVVRERDTRA